MACEWLCIFATEFGWEREREREREEVRKHECDSESEFILRK